MHMSVLWDSDITQIEALISAVMNYWYGCERFAFIMGASRRFQVKHVGHEPSSPYQKAKLLTLHVQELSSKDLATK